MLQPQHLPENFAWTSIFFCLIAAGPASSKCDLTSRMFVLPVCSSINWKSFDQRSSFGSLLQFAPVCHSCRDIHRVNRETAEDLNCPTGLSSWNRLFLGNLPSQESSLLQLERRIAERTQRESDRSKSDLSQPFCVSLLSSEPSEDTNRFLSAYSPNSLLSHILASMQSVYSLARNQSRG